MRLRIAGFALLAAASVLFSVTSRAEELTRIDQLREQIKATETLLEGATKPNEKARFQTQLDRLRNELENQEQGLRIEQRERELEKSRTDTPQSALEELLRRFDVSADHVKEELTRNENESRQLETQRDQLVEQRTVIKTDTDKGAAAAAELDERIINAREGIIALNLEHDALSEELRLAQEVDRISKPLKTAAAQTAVSLTQVFEARAQLRSRETQMATDSVQLANLTKYRANKAASLELGRQKLAQIDEEISLLEKQTGIFNTNPAIARLLNSTRSQKKYLDARIATFARQVAAIDRTINAVTKRSDLLAKEKTLLAIDYDDIKARYLRRLAPPSYILVGLTALFFVISRVVLPMTRSRESVLLARRLTRYLFILAATTVVCVFLFDDLEKVLTTLGIVSAAMVIALQDVCASIAGWFVIIAGAKFRIGDRIEVDGDCGDVLDIELLRTTMLEVGKSVKPGEVSGLGLEHPTGRIIVLPNSFVLKGKVFNATHGHPYIWCRQVFTFTNETPWREAEATVQRVLEEETAADFEAARHAAQKMEKRYGVNDAEYQPKIYIRLADWGVEFTCLHVSHFRKINETQARIHRRMAEEISANPRLVTAYPTQRQVTGFEHLTMPELAHAANAGSGSPGTSSGPTVSALASMPAGSVASVIVTDERAVENANGQYKQRNESAPATTSVSVAQRAGLSSK